MKFVLDSGFSIVGLFDGTSGPRRNVKYAIVGESYGSREREKQTPFIGDSGDQLNLILAESGIARSECFCTNVVNEQPRKNNMWEFFYPTQEARKDGRPLIKGLYPHPNVVAGVERLHAQLQAVNPEVVIAFGNYSLWALTSNSFKLDDKEKRKVPTGIGAWRGSELCTCVEAGAFPLIPTYHPAAAMRQWQWRYLIKHDIKQRLPAYRQRNWQTTPFNFVSAPSFKTALNCLSAILRDLNNGITVPLANDIETRNDQIACISLAWSAFDAICIPFMRGTTGSYWPPDQERTLVMLIREVLTHPNVRNIGQNNLYDSAFYSLYWAIDMDCWIDTMTYQHVIWPGTPKGLGYLSSLYCESHKYWKDEGKLDEDHEWGKDVPEEVLWHYCCEDSARSYEIAFELKDQAEHLGLTSQCQEKMDEWHMAYRMMKRGVAIDRKRRASVTAELINTVARYEARLASMIPPWVHTSKKGASVWYRSPKQCGEIFYDALGISEMRSRKTKSRTCDDAALDRIARIEPMLFPLTSALQEYRSLSKFYEYCVMKLDRDSRARCFWKTTGAYSMRWASSENPFGVGRNLENIPKGLEPD